MQSVCFNDDDNDDTFQRPISIIRKIRMFSWTEMVYPYGNVLYENQKLK